MNSKWIPEIFLYIVKHEDWIGTVNDCFPPAFTLVSCSAYSLAQKMEAICSAETSVDFQRTTRHCTPEETIIRWLAYGLDHLKVEILFPAPAELPSSLPFLHRFWDTHVIGKIGSLPTGKAAGTWSIQFSSPSAEVKNSRGYIVPPAPIRFRGVVRN
jgi:hypothetical protein